MDLLQSLILSGWVRVFLYVATPVLVALVFFFASPGQVFTIARNTFVEAVRQPIYFILIFLCGLLQVFNTWGTAYSMAQSDYGEITGDNRLLLDVGLATVFVCGMLLTAFVATAVLSREIENRTILTVISKPISRPAVVLGKFLGVAGAIFIATATMTLFLLLSIRHGVMSTAADDPDMPVIIFSGAAVVIAVGVGIWGNFFYGWVFTQTTTLLLFPLILLAWVLVLFVGKKWDLQLELGEGAAHLWSSLKAAAKPQVLLASLGVLLAQLVLTSVATAASARLGQVMTILVCCGVFVFGLLSNHLLGRRAFDNQFVARIQEAAPANPTHADLYRTGDTYRILLEQEPRRELSPGTAFHYAENPNGFPLSTVYFTDVRGDVGSADPGVLREMRRAIVVVSASGRSVTIRHVGPDGGLIRLRPQAGDYVFIKPTRVNPLMMGAWGVVPNIQFFWLVDAVNQNVPITGSHFALITLYSFVQMGAFLSLAVLLFQVREVG